MARKKKTYDEVEAMLAGKSSMRETAQVLATQAFNLNTASVKLKTSAVLAAAAVIEGDMMHLLPQDVQDALLALIEVPQQGESDE